MDLSSSEDIARTSVSEMIQRFRNSAVTSPRSRKLRSKETTFWWQTPSKKSLIHQANFSPSKSSMKSDSIEVQAHSFVQSLLTGARSAAEPRDKSESKVVRDKSNEEDDHEQADNFRNSAPEIDAEAENEGEGSPEKLIVDIKSLISSSAQTSDLVVHHLIPSEDKKMVSTSVQTASIHLLESSNGCPEFDEILFNMNSFENKLNVWHMHINRLRQARYKFDRLKSSFESTTKSLAEYKASLKKI